MYNVNLYNRNNFLQQSLAQGYLEKYKDAIDWKPNPNVLDIGCAEGTVTVNIIHKAVPHCKKLVGFDINKDMIEFANKNYSSENVNFMVLDIAGDLPDHLRGQFHHAFSFFVLNWVQQQKIAFQNIYDMLQKDGDCLLVFAGHGAIFDAFKNLSHSKRWSYWVKNPEKYISPYHESRDSDNIRKMLSDIGFTNIKIQYEQVTHNFENMEAFRGTLKPLMPFKIPEEYFEEFLDDFSREMQDVDTEKYNLEKSSAHAVFNFWAFEIYAKKK